MAVLENQVDLALRALIDSGTADYIGEPVSQIEHALQAAHFAAHAKAHEDEVLAALFHDVGHLIASPSAPQMDGLGVVDHEAIGARFLVSLGFSHRVASLVAGHVQAKRYLTARNAAYAARLSEASTGTLRHQGGPMSDAEADAFEQDPDFRSKLRVRQWDEMAKIQGLQVPDLESYRDMISRNLESIR